MEQEEKKMLTKAEYERLCSVACVGFVPSGSKDADEEALLFAICREVYKYLDQDFMFIPAQGASNLCTYKWNLQQLVSRRQVESFDTLETAGKHINKVLD